jgi:hypothetical protein
LTGAEGATSKRDFTWISYLFSINSLSKIFSDFWLFLNFTKSSQIEGFYGASGSPTRGAVSGTFAAINLSFKLPIFTVS